MLRLHYAILRQAKRRLYEDWGRCQCGHEWGVHIPDVAGSACLYTSCKCSGGLTTSELEEKYGHYRSDNERA